jgi:hypothetical protein
VSFTASTNTALVGLPVGGKTRLVTDVELARSSALQYDLKVVNASGEITANGAELPPIASTFQRGNAIFRDRLLQSSGGFGVGTVGPGNFSGPLFAASYEIQFWTTSVADLPGLPANAATLLGVSCLPQRVCSRRSSDLTGMWTVTTAGFGELDVEIVQQGTDLRASGHGDNERDGTSYTITRDGTSIAMRSTLGACAPFVLRLELVDGCTMVGSAYCSIESDDNARKVWATR